MIMRNVALTDSQYQILLQCLGWIEAAGQYSELAETWNGREWRSFETMADRVRKAKPAP